MIPKREMQSILSQLSTIPLSKEYKELLFQFPKLLYKWNDHINNALDFQEKEFPKLENVTAYRMKLDYDMDQYITNICKLRNEILIMSSMLVLIGLNVPGQTALNKIKKIYTMIDDQMLLNFAVIERYKSAILNRRKKFTLKGLTLPMSYKEIEKVEDWPDDECTLAFFQNACKMFHFGKRD